LNIIIRLCEFTKGKAPRQALTVILLSSLCARIKKAAPPLRQSARGKISVSIHAPAKEATYKTIPPEQICAAMAGDGRL